MSSNEQQTSGFSSEADDAADEYVVIHDADDSDKCSLTSGSTAQKVLSPNTADSLTTVADIAKGLDGDGMTVSSFSQHTPMSGSYSQAVFSASSIFGTFDIDHLREMVRCENEQNRLTLDQIKSTLSELAKEKSNNNELNELVGMQKNSLKDTLEKLQIAEQSNLEKYERIVRQEEKLAQQMDEITQKDQQIAHYEADVAEKDGKISELEGMVQKLLCEKEQLEQQVAKANEEMANKDEIVNVLREESDEQQQLHAKRSKESREHIDILERMLASYRDRGEVNFD